jgi:acyl-CoA dehydrogenase
MNFDIPEALREYLTTLDRFIDAEIKPLEQADDNIRFFDHRREWARTDFDRGGLPRPEWEALLREARRRADHAGHYRFALPKDYGGQDGSNLWMAVIREHFAAKGLGLHNDLQNEHSIVGNHPIVLIFRDFGTAEQNREFIDGLLDGSRVVTFGLTEPDHGSDATHMEARAIPEARDGREGWRIDGEKMWTTGMHVASHCMLFARTSGNAGDAAGITCFLVPANEPGVKVEEYLWTFNMPTDHPRVSFRNVWVPETSILGSLGGGLAVAQHFVHENRIRQAASSLGAAAYCIEESVKYARLRKPFGQALANNQAIQWPLVELATQVEMLRLLIRKTAWEMDQMPKPEVERRLSDKVSMCNYWANRLCCEAADRAMQVHGGIGYSRHKPFEHIYRHHRRYRITEGSEEIQMRKIAGHLFGFLGPRRKEFFEMERAHERAKAAKKAT